jgi:hypothetical protein
LQRGDLVAIGVAGADASSMFSSYNGRPHPSEVGWDTDRLIDLVNRRKSPGIDGAGGEVAPDRRLR